MDLREAEDIKKRWQEYTEELYTKDLQDQDNHNGVITHLDPDILECEVKGALESITMNKASGGDGIPVELFQIQKDDAMKVLNSICQQVWKTQQWLRTGKGQFSFQSQGKAMPQNAQTTAHLHSSHTLVSNAQNCPSQASAIHEHELPYIQAGFRKGRGTRDQIANIRWIIKKAREFQKTSISALLTMPKPLTVFSSVQLLSSVQLFATP